MILTLWCQKQSRAASQCEQGSLPPAPLTPPWHTGVREPPAAQNNLSVRELESLQNPNVEGNHIAQDTADIPI